MKPKIYVAGPYTKTDPCINTNRAIQIGNRIWDRGLVPFIPHLSHFWHSVTPRPYAQWLEYDNEWVPLCDAVLRFPGESSGADAEVVLAKSHGIPVFMSEEDLFLHFKV
jgi:hypothetical protein